MTKKIIMILLITVVLSVLFVNCREKYELIDVEKLEAQELALLKRFYESSHFKDTIATQKLAIKDSTIIDGIVSYEYDTLNLINSLNFFRVRHFRSDRSIYVDSIQAGQTVGFRYSFFLLEDIGEKGEPIANLLYSNVMSLEPDIYTVGSFSYTSNVCYGIDLGLRNMFLYDKCTMIIPSAIGAQAMLTYFSIYDQYKTIIAEIEVTYMPRN